MSHVDELFYYLATLLALRTPMCVDDIKFHASLYPPVLLATGEIGGVGGSTLLHAAVRAGNRDAARTLAVMAPGTLESLDDAGRRPLDLTDDASFLETPKP